MLSWCAIYAHPSCVRPWISKLKRASSWEFLHTLYPFPSLWRICIRELNQTELHHTGVWGPNSWLHKQRRVLGGQGGFWWREGVVLEEDQMGFGDAWELWKALYPTVILWGWMDSSEKLLITYCPYKREWVSCRLWLRYWHPLPSDSFVCKD